MPDRYAADGRLKHESWVWDKHVNIATVATLLVQMAVAVWWGAAVTVRLETNINRVAAAETKIEQLQQMAVTVAVMNEKLTAAGNAIAAMRQDLNSLTQVPTPRVVPIVRPKSRSTAGAQ